MGYGIAKGLQFLVCDFELFVSRLQFLRALKNFSLCRLPRRDVVEDNRDLSVVCVAKTTSVNVIPAMQLFGLVFKTSRFACQGDATIGFEPVLFVIRSQFAHALADGIAQSG